MTYQSPQLSIQEIVSSLKEVNIDVSEMDFRKPDPRKWRYIYSQFYESLTSRSIELTIQSMNMMGKVGISCPNPEAFEEAAAQMSFTLCLQRLFSSCLHSDFSLRDVIHPGPKTVQRLASVFLNRSRHDGGVKLCFEEAQEKAQKSFEQYGSLLKRNKDLKESFANETESIHPELHKIEDEVASANKVLEEMRVIQEEEKRASQDLKLKISDMDATKAALKQVIEQKNQECEKLSKKIVQSPKKFQVELDRLKRKVADMRSDFEMQEQSFATSKLLMEHTKNKIDAATRAFKLVQEVQSDFDEHDKLCGETGKLKEKHGSLQEALNSLSLQQEDLAERFRIREAQKWKLGNQTDQRQQTGMHKLMDLKQYWEVLQENKNSVVNETKSAKDSLTQLKLEVSDIDNKIATEKEDLKKEEDGFVKLVEYLDEISEQNFTCLKTCLSNQHCSQ